MKQLKQLEVRYCKWGLANFYGDYIEINEALRNRKELRDKIIKHELGHSSDFDLFHDYNPRLGMKVIPFLLTHPKTWIDFFPIQYKNKEFVFDFNLLMIYGITLGLGLLVLLVLK